MSKPHSRPYDSVLDTIGWTPLVRVRRLAEGIRTPIYLKLASFNPGGSVKDRIGVAIVDAAERDGSLEPGGTIVEGTAGNTGLALAMVAAVRRRITREEGMLAGGSMGLIVSVALEVAAEVDDPDACVVALFCDIGERYLSKLYDDAWMEENGFL